MAESIEVWTIRAALDWCCKYLNRKGDDNPRLSAERLLAKATGLARVELYINFDRPLSSGELKILHDFVARRGAGEPLQYITGEVAFRHVTIKVRSGVLIPRPETEVLVSEALSLLPVPNRRHATDSSLATEEAQELLAAQAAAQKAQELLDEASISERSDETSYEAEAVGESDIPECSDEKPRRLYVADICTGSGCIACSIAYEHPDTCVVATDISADACELARQNVLEMGLGQRIYVAQGNMGAAVPERFIGKLDLVVSNPPYVPTHVMADIPREVATFEPQIALDGGADGLDLFRPLTQWACRALKPGGGYAVELHETCLEAAASIAAASGLCDVHVVSDLAGRPRILSARKPLSSA